MKACYLDGVSIKNKRSTNMDSLLLLERTVGGEKLYLAAVCDGVGSLEDGAYASAQIVRKLREWFDGVTSTPRLGLRLRNFVTQLNHQIIVEASAMGLQTASTLSVLLLCGNQYHLVHVGDSRIYLMREGVMTTLTHDDTSLDGKLTGCMGHTDRLSLLYREGASRGCIFLLCTDGLYKRTDETHLEDELRQVKAKNLRRTVDRLAQYAVDQGEKDNISLAIIISES